MINLIVLRVVVRLPGVMFTVMKGVQMIASGHANVPWVTTLILGVVGVEFRDLLVKPFGLTLPAVSNWRMRLLVICPLVVTLMQDTVRNHVNDEVHRALIAPAAKDELAQIETIRGLWLSGSAQIPKGDPSTRLASRKRLLEMLLNEPLSTEIAKQLDEEARTPSRFQGLPTPPQYIRLLQLNVEIAWQTWLLSWLESFPMSLFEVLWLLLPYVPAEQLLKWLDESGGNNTLT